MEETRIDKYMWAIRLFKTRTMATTACNAGKVKMNKQSVKPAHIVRVGDIFKVRVHHQVKTIEIIAIIEKRVGAKIAKQCYNDITPEEDKLNVHRAAFFNNERRDKGTGRPTKKERRDIEDLKSTNFDDWENW